MKKNREYILSSLDNALKLMDALSVHDDIGLKEICEMTGIDRSSAFKMLYTLANRGYVLKTNHAHYLLGPKFTGYNTLQPKRKTVLEAATPYLDDLHSRIMGTVYMGILSTTGKMIITYQAISSNKNDPHARVGFEVDIHSNAMGKVLLANADEGFINALLNHIQLLSYASNTITDKKVLLSQLSKIREDGYCVEHNEQRDGTSSIGAPIFDNRGRCVASIGIACSTDYLSANQDKLISQVTVIAKAIQYNTIY